MATRVLIGTLVATVVCGAPVARADDGYNGAPSAGSGAPIPTLAGIPCVASNIGICSSIVQNQPRPRPRTSIGSAPRP